MKKYNVTVNGVETTLMLTDEDAEARGLKAKPESKAKTAANKARNPSNKQAEAPKQGAGGDKSEG